MEAIATKITDSGISVGAWIIDGEPLLGIKFEDSGSVNVFGRFTSEEAAIAFMEALAMFMDADIVFDEPGQGALQ